MTGQKAAREEKFGNVARTVSCITTARPEGRIWNSRATDPWSYATRIPTRSWLRSLLHGDRVFPSWPKMAKTAKFGRNGAHSRSDIPMVRASINPEQGCYGHIGLRSRYMPHINPRDGHYPFFPIVEKWYTKNCKWQDTPLWASHGSSIPRRGYRMTHSIQGGFMSPFQISLNLALRVHTTRGRT